MTQMIPEEKPSGESPNDSTRMKTFANYLLKGQQKSTTKTTGSRRRVIFFLSLLVPLCLIVLWLAVQLELLSGLKNLGLIRSNTSLLGESFITPKQLPDRVCGNFLEDGTTDSTTWKLSVKHMYGIESFKLSILCLDSPLERWRVHNL